MTGADLPARAALYFVGSDGEAYGPYQGRGPNGNGEFWTDSVSGSEGVLLVRHVGPASPSERRQTAFVVAAVGHIAPDLLEPAEQVGEPFCGNPSCVVDVSCLTHPAVADVTSAVAQLQWIAGAYIYACTGGLLADTDPATQIPYLLTANHCLSRAKDARNLEAFFFYRTSACGESSIEFRLPQDARCDGQGDQHDRRLHVARAEADAAVRHRDAGLEQRCGRLHLGARPVPHQPSEFRRPGVFASSRRHRGRNLRRLAAR